MAYSVQHNTPTNGSIQWSGMSIQYLRDTYAIVNGHTNTRYAYWTPAYPNNLVVTNDFPALGDDDCLIFVNKSGTALTVPNSTVVSGDLIIPGSILADSLAANSVTADKIMAGAVSATSLAANSVTAAAICADAIGAVHISADAVTADAIVTGAVTADAMAANSVLANSIAANAVTADKIATNAVTANKILAGAIESGKIATNAIVAGNITAGAITAGKIATDAIVAGNIQANAITTDKIIANGITTAKIASSAVTANEILANTITAGKIASDAIEARHIKAGQIDTGMITSGAQETLRIQAVNSIRIGGTNKLVNSGIPIATSDYMIKKFDLDSDIETGQTYTFSLKGTKPAGAKFDIWINEASTFCVTLEHTGATDIWKGTFTCPTVNAGKARAMWLYRELVPGTCFITRAQLEAGNMMTDWGPAQTDPSAALKSSYIDIASDHISVVSGGHVSIAAGGNFNVRAGAGASGVGISNDTGGTPFLWAGHSTPSSAPFRVMMDGKVYATNLQQTYSQSFWDMSDNDVPAEFWVYIPPGYTVDSVQFSTRVSPCRTFAKSASSGGGGTSGIKSQVSIGGNSVRSGGGSSTAQAHTHVTDLPSWYVPEHSHSTPSHSHGLNFGVTAASAGSISGIKTYIYINSPSSYGIYSPNPGTLEIGSLMISGWNSLKAWTDLPARIDGFVMVKITAN